MKVSSRRNVIRYLVVTGALSGVLFAPTALLIADKAPLYLQIIAKNVSAWAPTVSVLVMFRRLFPGQRLGEFLKRNLSVRVNPLTFVLLLCIQFGVFALAVAAQLWICGKGVNSLTLVSLPEVMMALVVQLTSGATGEELGWRAYLLKELQTRHSLLVSALLVGIVWGFWHLPVWFTLGYMGNDLVLYVVYFLVQIISISIMIAVFYNRQGNLLIPIWIHFLSNFLVALVKIDRLGLLGWISLGYAVLAIILISVERKSVFESNSF